MNKIKHPYLVYCIGIVLFLIASNWWTSGAKLSIYNQTNENIYDLNVKVFGKNFQLGTLSPGKKKKVTIRKYSDSDWKITGRWESSGKINESIGYITHGANFRDTIIIKGRDNFEYDSSMGQLFGTLI